MKTVFCMLLILGFFNCQKITKDENKTFLEIYYMGPGINTPYDYSCGMISKDFLKDEMNYRKITDKESVESFMKMYKNYKISTDSSGMNTRIKVLVHTKNIVDTLCMGEHFNTYKNGTKVNDNKELLAYVKKVIDYENTVPSFVKKHPERYKH